MTMKRGFRGFCSKCRYKKETGQSELVKCGRCLPSNFASIHKGMPKEITTLNIKDYKKKQIEAIRENAKVLVDIIEKVDGNETASIALLLLAMGNTPDMIEEQLEAIYYIRFCPECGVIMNRTDIVETVECPQCGMTDIIKNLPIRPDE